MLLPPLLLKINLKYVFILFEERMGVEGKVFLPLACSLNVSNSMVKARSLELPASPAQVAGVQEELGP